MNNDIYIKGTRYRIKIEKPNQEYLGETDTKKRTITITTENDKKEIEKTIIHELLHAYFYECGLRAYSSNEILIEYLDSIFKDIMKKTKQVNKIFDQLKNKARGVKYGRNI